MTFRILVVLTLMLSYIPTQSSFAQSSTRQVSAQEIQQRMLNKDRTYWPYYKIDRFYFSPNSKMIHQINEPWGNIPIGTILNATTRISDDALCWKYNDEDIAKFGISKNELCFDLYTKTSEEDFMVGNHPEIQLKAKGQGLSSPTIFNFDSWHLHDYIYDPAIIEDISEAMDTMAMYRKDHKGKIPKGTIRRRSLLPHMQAYYDLAIGKVFSINRDYMYFDPSGDHYWITGDRIDAAKGDIDKMIELANMGTWSIKDNIMCWQIGGYASSCEYIFPIGTGLKDRTSKEFLGTFHTGMTRYHHDDDEHIAHVTLEQSEVPELFKRFRKMSQDIRAK